ncbi:hypothetical protein [Nitrosomonas aestuarii]|uniref:hypothetical protein n=1 Tax=Nitrosomonas aestuarii TaxID=52441 RepID=UPI000D2F91A0|nr:hypothetical protein [Nitrosomonas aestuarii]PTN12755.1 hypothetical protein C8R11_10230 [Nitrosomonas aestuarii]
MKTGNSIAVLSNFAFLIAGLSMNSFASVHNDEGNFAHSELAGQYENLAREMRTKAQEQLKVLEVLNTQPHFSFFDKNGQKIKKYVSYQIHGCEKAAKKFSEKAAYHQAIASEHSRPESTVNPNHTAH